LNADTTGARPLRASTAAAGGARPERRRNADFSRLAEVEQLWVPAVARIREYAEEAIDLQELLRNITKRLEAHLATAIPPG
jgi:hypothetical protein